MSEMTPLTVDLLTEVSERPAKAWLPTFVASLNARLPDADIWSPLRVAHFLAQCACEMDGFNTLVEYGTESYFARYDGHNGNTQPGDGFLFRGRGAVDLTGRSLYAEYGPKVGVDLIANPDQAADPDTAVAIACAYWNDTDCSERADADDLRGVTVKINGGLNGYSDRAIYLSRAKRALGL